MRTIGVHNVSNAVMEKPKQFPAEVKNGTFFEHDVPIDKMFVHYRSLGSGYARPLRPNRVKKLASKWDRQAAGVLLLSMRADGTFAIIDGQHRREAAILIGLKTLDALVYIDLSLEDEARLYRKFGDYLKQTALDRYHAGVIEGDQASLEIKRILSYRDLYVPDSPGAYSHGIIAVEALVSVYERFGANVLRATIGLLHEAWGTDYHAYRASQVKGTAAFLIRFVQNPKFNRKRLVERMVAQGINSVNRSADSLRDALVSDGPTAWGRALLNLHDRSLSESARLGEWTARHLTEEVVVKMRENIVKMRENLTPEQRKDNALRGAQKLTPEQRTARGVRAAATRRGYSVRSVKCPYCHAKSGMPCRRENGDEAKDYHLGRKEEARARYEQQQSAK